MKDSGRKALAALYGALCHGSFAVAVTLMARGLFDGMQSGHGTLHGSAAALADGLLLLQFPVLHSLFLDRRRGMPLLQRLAPTAVAGPLTATLFAFVAALQIGATFYLWSPSGEVIYRAHGTGLVLHGALFVAAWLFLGKALLDAGLGLQTGWIGWTAVWRGARPSYPRMPERGLFGRCRQPIYLGFFLVLWTGPVWTLDHLAIAIAWGAYCVVGPLHKERRFAATFGRTFAAYRRRVPYFFPRLFL